MNELININQWLKISISDRLYFYKSSFAAGKYNRTKKQCLYFAANLVKKDENADVFLLSL